MITKELPGYQVSNVFFPLVEDPKSGERQKIPSEYPAQFLFALQMEQVRVEKLLVATDEDLERFVVSRLRSKYPNVTAGEYRASAQRLKSVYQRVIEALQILHQDANQPVLAEEVSTSYTTRPINYPRVHTYDGKEYLPKRNGWQLRDGSGAIDLNSEDGISIWQVATDTLSPLQQCLLTFIQSDSKNLTQAELDILFTFDLIDRRVKLSQQERDLRIARKTPLDARTAEMIQLLSSTPNSHQS